MGLPVCWKGYVCSAEFVAKRCFSSKTNSEANSLIKLLLNSSSNQSNLLSRITAKYVKNTAILSESWNKSRLNSLLGSEKNASESSPLNDSLKLYNGKNVTEPKPDIGQLKAANKIYSNVARKRPARNQQVNCF